LLSHQSFDSSQDVAKESVANLGMIFPVL